MANLNSKVTKRLTHIIRFKQKPEGSGRVNRINV